MSTARRVLLAQRPTILLTLTCAAWLWSSLGDSLVVVRVSPPFLSKHGARTMPIRIGFAGAFAGERFVAFHGDACVSDCTRLRDAADAAHAALLLAIALVVLAMLVRLISTNQRARRRWFSHHSADSDARAGRLRVETTLLYGGIGLAVGAATFFGLVIAIASRAIEDKFEAQVVARIPFVKLVQFVPGAGGGGGAGAQHDAHHLPRPGRHAFVLLAGVVLATAAAAVLQGELASARSGGAEKDEAFMRNGGGGGGRVRRRCMRCRLRLRSPSKCAKCSGQLLLL